MDLRREIELAANWTAICGRKVGDHMAGNLAVNFILATYGLTTKNRKIELATDGRQVPAEKSARVALAQFGPETLGWPWRLSTWAHESAAGVWGASINSSGLLISWLMLTFLQSTQTSTCFPGERGLEISLGNQAN